MLEFHGVEVVLVDVDHEVVPWVRRTRHLLQQRVSAAHRFFDAPAIPHAPEVSQHGWPWSTPHSRSPCGTHTLRRLSAAQSSAINTTMVVHVAVLAWIFLGQRLSSLDLGLIRIGGEPVALAGLRRRPNGRCPRSRDEREQTAHPGSATWRCRVGRRRFRRSLRRGTITVWPRAPGRGTCRGRRSGTPPGPRAGAGAARPRCRSRRFRRRGPPGSRSLPAAAVPARSVAG